MGRKQRIQVYPEPETLALLGSSSPALNQALDCWAFIVSDMQGRLRSTEGTTNLRLLARKLRAAKATVGLSPLVRDPGGVLSHVVDDVPLAEVIARLNYVQVWSLLTLADHLEGTDAEVS